MNSLAPASVSVSSAFAASQPPFVPPTHPNAVAAYFLSPDGIVLGWAPLLLPSGSVRVVIRTLDPPPSLVTSESNVLNPQPSVPPGQFDGHTAFGNSTAPTTNPPLIGQTHSTMQSGSLWQLVEDTWRRCLDRKADVVTVVKDVVCAPRSPLLRVAEQVKQLAGVPLPILLVGEPGTGKTAFGREVHALSRREGIFRHENCSTYQTTSLDLIRSVLVGIGKNSGLPNVPLAGTDGLLQMTDKGTLFMDEISRLPLAVQADLLLLMEGHPFRKAAGISDPIRVSIRFVFATNCDPIQLLNEGRLSSDFYDRIRTLVIPVPPLRDRREDIPALIQHFTEPPKKSVAFTKDLYAALIFHDWPSNVRGLKSFITLVQSLPDLPDRTLVGLAQIEKLALDPVLVTGLRLAHARYSAAEQLTAQSVAEDKLVHAVADQAASFFRQVISKPGIAPDSNWRTLLTLSLNLLKESLAGLGFNSLSGAPASTAFALLKSCGLEDKSAKLLLRRAFAQLKATPKIWLSSRHLQPRYLLLEAFFGLSHDALRAAKKRKS